jgi:hypothetical protein
MSHSLPAIIQHVRSQNRPNSYGGMLVAELDRLNARIADLTDAWLGAALLPHGAQAVQVTTDTPQPTQAAGGASRATHAATD